MTTAPASDEVLQKIRTAFQIVFGSAPESIDASSSPDDIEGWDSLGHVTLASELEKQFALTFTVDELMEMQDVASIMRIVGARH